VDTEHDAITGVVATGAVAIGEFKEVDVVVEEETAEAAVLAWAAWCWAARWSIVGLIAVRVTTVRRNLIL
jgi:hypothetical protein